MTDNDNMVPVPTWVIALGELGEEVLNLTSQSEEHLVLSDLPDYALHALHHMAQAGAEVSAAAQRGLEEARP